MIFKFLLISIISNIALCDDWSIDTTYSYIKYSGSHTFHSWSGISNDIDFLLDCKNDYCAIEISTSLESFNSGNDSRDSNMLYYTESLQYPKVSFKSETFKFNKEYEQSIDLEGDLYFHGIEKKIPLKIELTKSKKDLWGTCSFNFELSNFNVDRPSLLMIKISDLIEVEAKLKLNGQKNKK